jgi:hypothetical protein
MPGMTCPYISRVIATTVMGALGEQLSQISKGRDPINIEDPKFWAQAAMRGGGVGIFGDFLFQDQNRYGGGMLATLAGPVLGGQLPAAFNLTVGNIQQVVADDRTNAGRELSRFIRQNAPGYSLWYARLRWNAWCSMSWIGRSTRRRGRGFAISRHGRGGTISNASSHGRGAGCRRGCLTCRRLCARPSARATAA